MKKGTYTTRFRHGSGERFDGSDTPPDDKVYQTSDERFNRYGEWFNGNSTWFERNLNWLLECRTYVYV